MNTDALNLTPAEIVQITGRIRSSAQIRALTKMGFTFNIDANGQPIVARAHYLQAMGVAAANESETVQLYLGG